MSTDAIGTSTVALMLAAQIVLAYVCFLARQHVGQMIATVLMALIAIFAVILFL